MPDRSVRPAAPLRQDQNPLGVLATSLRRSSEKPHAGVSALPAASLITVLLQILDSFTLQILFFRRQRFRHENEPASARARTDIHSPRAVPASSYKIPVRHPKIPCSGALNLGRSRHKFRRDGSSGSKTVKTVYRCRTGLTLHQVIAAPAAFCVPLPSRTKHGIQIGACWASSKEIIGSLRIGHELRRIVGAQSSILGTGIGYQSTRYAQ
jgi:hypothetical protein